MGSLSVEEEFHAKKEKVVGELIRGKEIATQLQTLLLKRVEDDEPVSYEDLALQIFRSFSVSISHLTSGQIPTVDHGGSSSCSGESKRKRAGKDRRGCYKRRTNPDSRVTVSPTIEDGWAWRKYGQKNILNSDHPRCYYRCSHKQEAGCKANKQVQRMKGETVSYETTYFNDHTCAEMMRAPHLIVESDPVQHNLISFQTNIQPPDPIITLKQEDTHSEDASGIIDQEAKSTLEDTWQDIIGFDLSGYKPGWVPYQEEVASRFDHYSSEISSLQGLDMEEVDQLSDINSLRYFDEIINY